MTVHEFRIFAWCDLAADGWKARDIAAAWCVSPRTVQAGLREARDLLDSCIQNQRHAFAPRLTPFWPCISFTPASTCNHGEVPIPEGDAFCCGVCHRSGIDGIPAMQRDPRTDPQRRRPA